MRIDELDELLSELSADLESEGLSLDTRWTSGCLHFQVFAQLPWDAKMIVTRKFGIHVTDIAEDSHPEELVRGCVEKITRDIADHIGLARNEAKFSLRRKGEKPKFFHTLAALQRAWYGDDENVGLQRSGWEAYRKDTKINPADGKALLAEATPTPAPAKVS